MKKQLKIKIVSLPIYRKDNAFWYKESSIIAILKYKNRRIRIECIINSELEIDFENHQEYVYYGKEATNHATNLDFNDIQIIEKIIKIKNNNCFTLNYKIKGLHKYFIELEDKYETYSEALLAAIDTISDENYYEELETHNN